jgi:hypothetical protein
MKKRVSKGVGSREESKPLKIPQDPITVLEFCPRCRDPASSSHENVPIYRYPV